MNGEKIENFDKVVIKGEEAYKTFSPVRCPYFESEVLKLSRTVQGIWETKHFERMRVHSRTDTILKPVIYYEFIAILNRIRIKVVVKQIDSGEKFFWSIIPF